MVPLFFLQESLPLQWERYGLVRPPLFAPRSVLETSQKDTREEEDGQPRLQREVRFQCLICTVPFYSTYLRCCCPEYLTASSFCRFEFDILHHEVQTRKLDVSVKNNKMFYTRERKDIGMVGKLPGSAGSIRLSISSTAWGNIVSRSALAHRYWLISQRWIFPKASRNGTHSKNICCTHFIQPLQPSGFLSQIKVIKFQCQTQMFKPSVIDVT